MDSIRKKYTRHVMNKRFLTSFIVSFFLLIGSLVINYHAGQYATERQSNSVTDIVLSNIRVFDVEIIFIYGALSFWIFIAFLCIFNPKRIPFTLKTIAFFVIVRSIFVTLTHIAPFSTQTIFDSSTLVSYFTFGGDLFFSGHTGLPFLMALVFWKNVRLRILCIALSIFFGIVVLMGHLHYTIDVLSAFFITYGIYRIAEMIFKKDLAIFHSEDEE